MLPIPPLTVFDVETTGLDPKSGHRIIEIAGVRIENGKIDESKTFVSFVNPERQIPWETKQIHKISDEDVQNAPTIDHVLPKFLEFASGSILIAHNAQFDMGFLDKEKEFCWGYVELPECLCTMKFSQALFPTQFRHNLDVLSQRLGLTPSDNRHRALPDVLLTAQAFLKMMELAETSSFDAIRQHCAVNVMA